MGLRTQRGLSLIEMMVAMVIGVALIGGTVTVFSGSKRSALLNTTLTELQESARFALDSMVRDVRLAGFQGCIDAGSAVANVLAVGAPTTNFFDTALVAFEIDAAGTWIPAAPLGFTPPAAGAPGAPMPGTHALSVQFASPETYPIMQMPTVFAPVVLANGVRAADIGIVAGDIAVVSDCQVADIFAVSAVNASSIAHAATVNRDANGISTGQLSADYGEPPGSDRTRARVMRFEANIYYIGDTGRTNPAGDPVTALYRMSLPYVAPPPAGTPLPPIEMVEGAANLRLRVAAEQPGPGGSYVFSEPATAAALPGPVSRVEIGLLMQSYDRVADQPDTRSYTLAGSTVTAGAANDATTYRSDRRMRLAFNTTVDVRNR